MLSADWHSCSHDLERRWVKKEPVWPGGTGVHLLWASDHCGVSRVRTGGREAYATMAPAAESSCVGVLIDTGEE